MSEQIIKIPDIGTDDAVEVIELLVKVGDTVTEDQGLMTLESDKASMDVPAPMAGKITEILIKVGDKVNEGAAVVKLDTASEASAAEAVDTSSDVQASGRLDVQTILVPDIGGDTDVEVIELLVSAGDTVELDQGLVTLESDKASMDVPTTVAGKVTEVLVKVGDKVSEGSEIAKVEGVAASVTSNSQPPASNKTTERRSDLQTSRRSDTSARADVLAGPSVRRIAHELDIDLGRVRGTGEKGRITKDDIKNYLSQGSGGGSAIPAMPKVDFSKFGEIEVKKLNKIKKLTGQFMQRNWLNIPHVTQFADADITDMEAHRQKEKKLAAEKGIKLTPLVFIMKAVVAALKEFPQFNTSLDPSGESLIYKKYYNIGVAVDTPNGLVVPVIRNVNCKSLFELAQELGDISKKAREEGLTPAEMQGGCFTISSLGGIGGTAFTPIVNAPEAAILGVSRSFMKPVYQEDGSFKARLTLPLSLSYDHRIIDGADGARFAMYLCKCLEDISLLI